MLSAAVPVFRNLTVGASVYLGSRALPTLINSYRNFVEDYLIQLKLMRSHKQPFPILHGISAALQPVRRCSAAHSCSMSGSANDSMYVRAILSQHDLHILETLLKLPACIAAVCQKLRMLQGRLVLLLGPPGAGKSTLLKSLAGKLRKDPDLKVRVAKERICSVLWVCHIKCCLRHPVVQNSTELECLPFR